MKADGGEVKQGWGDSGRGWFDPRGWVGDKAGCGVALTDSSVAANNELATFMHVSPSMTYVVLWTLSRHPLPGTAAGQDLNLSLDRVNANRNFTNKVWNVGKFILFQLDKVSDQRWTELAVADFSAPGAVAALPLTDRWVVSATHQLVDRVTAAQDKYEFSEAGQALYAFIWGEFADW